MERMLQPTATFVVVYKVYGKSWKLLSIFQVLALFGANLPKNYFKKKIKFIYKILYQKSPSLQHIYTNQP